jgi:hypothetical protein
LNKSIILILYIIFLLAGVGCAWENLPQGQEETQRIIQVNMRMGGAMRSDLFYYIVFNLSGNAENKPYSVFDGVDRGKFWTVYYMWGTPPLKETGLYRGFGGKGVNGSNLIDRFPMSREYLNELLPGTTVEGDHMTLSIDVSKLHIPATTSLSVNMNMIVCNQAIDATSRLEYEYDPYVFDSFYGRGITMIYTSTADYWDELHNPQESIPNEHEDVAPPEANIIDWRFQIIAR